MINLSLYPLDEIEKAQILHIAEIIGLNPSLEEKRVLMDAIWDELGCNNEVYSADLYAKFYSHPIWLYQGLFVEHHDVSMSHREYISDAIAALAPRDILDFGGGFGTLARLVAKKLPQSYITICEPHPPRLGVALSNRYRNIKYMPQLEKNSCDTLVSTDVLEHVHDPIMVLSQMVNAVRPGGHLFLANCFYPVIKCHLPSTFHLRQSFDIFCIELGLECLGKCQGSHASIYRKIHNVEPDWKRIRIMEAKSKARFKKYFAIYSFNSKLKSTVRRSLRYSWVKSRDLLVHLILK